MLALGNKIIAGSFKAGASWEVGDVGISAFGIDEALNKRRYLNGQVISQAQFVEFTAMLKSRVSVYPNLATTEVNWQAEVTNSKLGQCGKFVIDDVAGTIRLPKVVNLQGLMDLTHLGETVEAGLPNITAQFLSVYDGDGNTPVSGAVTRTTNTISGSKRITGSDTTSKVANLVLDASDSSSIYGNSTTVQPESVQYPYFIQVATGVETSIDVSREIELNNPFSLLDYKYSEYELSNASWLLSNGQWNSGAVYQSVYDLLLQIYNGTVTKAGVSVKLSTEAYTDTDFVLNTGDTTFRLPVKVLLAGSKRVAGNGMSLGMTNGTVNFGIQLASPGAELAKSLRAITGAYGNDVSTTASYTGTTTGVVGITTDPLKSGIETSANGLYLYFYVGETVQDANIIAAAGVLNDMTNIKNGVGYSQLGTSFLSGLAMPSDVYDNLTVGASGSYYIAPADGYFSMYVLTGGSGAITLDNVDIYSNISSVVWTAGTNGLATYVPVRKGQTVRVGYINISQFLSFKFIYAKGSEWEKA